MGQVCGKPSTKEDKAGPPRPGLPSGGRSDRPNQEKLNPLNPHRPTAPAPNRKQPGDMPQHNVKEIDEWYNDLVRKLWPFINASVTKMCREMLPDLLQQSKPTWMTKLDLVKFELGQDPIVFTNLNVEEGPDPGHDDIFLDFDIRWDAPHLDFELAVNPMPKFVSSIPGIKSATTINVGVEDFYLEGRVRCSMVPLLKEIPVVGALQIALLGMPRFDMNLTLGVFDGLESVIKPWLKSFIEDFVLETYQLPGHYFLPLGNNIPDVQSPAGVLEVTVVEAVNVPKMDYLGQSSPYCKLWVTGAKKSAAKTPYVDKTKNPKFDESQSTFGFTVHAPDHQQLTLVLYDYDWGTADDEVARYANADDEIARTMIPIKDLAARDAQEVDFWVSFESDQQKKEREEREAKGEGADDGKKHGKDKGEQKGMFAKVTDGLAHALVPAAGGHDKELPNCRVRIRATYHSLEDDDVRRLNEAQEAHRPLDVSMIHEGPTRQVVERHNLMEQIVAANKPPGEQGGAAGQQDGGTAGQQKSGDKPPPKQEEMETDAARGRDQAPRDGRGLAAMGGADLMKGKVAVPVDALLDGAGRAQRF